MSKPNSSHLSDFERLYREKYHPLYEDFASRLHTLLEELTNKAGISFNHIEHRVKTVESFLDKIERKDYYENPFEQIKDFAGIRIVTYYQDDVDRIKDVIYKEFDVDEIHSVDKIEVLGADEFGYRSVHLVVSLSKPRSGLDEWRHLVGLVAEIQIRTILQHAWATIQRKIDYKVMEQQPPLELRRRLSRLSAQLESADEEFMALRDQAEKIIGRDRNELNQTGSDLPLSLDILRKFIGQKVDLQKWEQFGVQAGMEPFPQLVNKNYSIGLEILLLTLKTVGISNTVEFENLFPGFEKMTKPLRRFVDLVKSKGETVQAVSVDVLIFLVSFSKPNVIPMNFDWGEEYYLFIVEALREVCKELSDS